MEDFIKQTGTDSRQLLIDLPQESLAAVYLSVTMAGGVFCTIPSSSAVPRLTTQCKYTKINYKSKIMFKTFHSAACVAAMAMLSVASVSCQKDRSLSSNGNFSINADMSLNDVWSIVSPDTKADGEEPKPVYQYFVFDSGNLLVDHVGSYMSDSQISKSFLRKIEFISEAGAYGIVGVTNLLQGEYPSKVKDTRAVVGKSDLITLTGVRDVCLGSTSLTVSPAKLNYSTKVEAYHIMAQLGIAISGVPSDITELSVTLPSQSNQFDFGGKFFGGSQSISLNILRANSPATDGTYTWSVQTMDDYGTYDWQLIYPSCDAADEGETVPTTMPITIIATDSENKTYTFNSSTATRCTPGTRTKLTATWNRLKYTDSATMEINPWQGAQQTGSFELL